MTSKKRPPPVGASIYVARAGKSGNTKSAIGIILLDASGRAGLWMTKFTGKMDEFQAILTAIKMGLGHAKLLQKEKLEIFLPERRIKNMISGENLPSEKKMKDLIKHIKIISDEFLSVTYSIAEKDELEETLQLARQCLK